MLACLQNGLNLLKTKMIPFISIICPTYNEEKYIANCLEAIIQSDYPKEDMEILFVDGMSSDKTIDIILSYSKEHSYIKLLSNPHQTVPYAMNRGIEEAKGDVIIRIDAHAAYPTNYFSVLVHYLHELNADNVGVVCKTDVLHKNKKTLAIKEVLANKFGVGNSYFRIGTDKIMEVDTVPFGCYKKDVFERFGLYDTRLTRNQDIELNRRIVSGGGKIFLIPDIYCTYYARETWKAIMKNNFQNGKWNLLAVFYTKTFKTLSIRHFIPLLFVLSLLLPALLAIIDLRFIYIAVASLFAYLLLIAYVSISLAIQKKGNILYLLITFFALHLSYGIGSLIGIITPLFEGKKT